MFYTKVDLRGGKIYHSYKFEDKNGKWRTDYNIEEYGPSLFLNLPNEKAEYIPFGSQTKEKTLSRKEFKNSYEMFKFIRDTKDIGNTKLYGDKNVIRQFLSDRYHNLDNKVIPFDKIRKGFFDIEVLSGFIENGVLVEYGFPKANEAKFPIPCLTHYDSYDKKYHLFTTGKWCKEDSILEQKYLDIIELHQCKNEQELLAKYAMYFIDNRPDVLVGYNSNSFDIPYVVNRYYSQTTKSGTERVFSPFKIIEEKTGKNKFSGEEYQWYDIFGLGTIDYLELMRKYYLEEPLESFSLDFVGQTLLKKGKVEYKGSLNQLWYENPQLYNDYNIQDVIIEKELDDKLGYLNLTFTLGYLVKSNYLDVMSPVKTWESAIYNRGLKKGIIVPLEKEIPSSKENLPGAFVYPVKPQILYNIASFDFESLYPNIIRMLNIASDTILTPQQHFKIHQEIVALLSKNGEDELLRYFVEDEPIQDYYEKHAKLPDCLVEYLQDKDLCMSASLNLFHKSAESISVELVSEYFLDRKSDKAEYQRLKKEGNESLSDIYYNNQHAKKILLNSYYGAMANEYFKFSDIRLAKSVTLTGQLCIKSALHAVDNYLSKIVGQKTNFVAGGDTDSGYFELKPLIQKFIPNADNKKRVEFMDSTCKRIESHCLGPLYERLSSNLNAANNTIKMKREVICGGHGTNGGCGLFAATKHYFLLVDDSEGFKFDEPKEKIMGLHSKTRLCPKVVKPEFNKCLRLLVTKGLPEVRKYVNSLKEDFYKFDLNEVARPYSVSDVDRFKDPKTGLPYTGQWFDKTLQKQRNGGVPLQSKAAIYFNYILKEKGLENKYERIKDSDRIKIAFLKPNKYKFSEIAFKDELPEEFGMNEFIDWDEIYRKTFWQPLEDIIESCEKKSLEEKGDLDSWFE